MPTAPKRPRRRSPPAAAKEDEAEADSGDEGDSDSDSGSDDEGTEEDDGEEEEAEEPETHWFSLEGCEPTAADAPEVARLLRHCQLPPAVASAAADLAERLVASDESRRYTSVVKQSRGLDSDEADDDDDDEEEDDESVYSVVGLVNLSAVRRLLDFLAAASSTARAALASAGDGDGSVGLLVKARAPELPAELALPQLEGLRDELLGASGGVGCWRPRRLLLLSPAWRVAEAAPAESLHSEDDILQGLAAGPWELLQSSGAVASAANDSGGSAAAGCCCLHRVCVLEVGQLGEAVRRLRQAVGGRLKPPK